MTQKEALFELLIFEILLFVKLRSLKRYNSCLLDCFFYIYLDFSCRLYINLNANKKFEFKNIIYYIKIFAN